MKDTKHKKMTNKKTKYPTKNEIIKCKTEPTKSEIRITKHWKKTLWNKKLETEEKKTAITMLIMFITESHNNKNNGTKYRPIKIRFNSKIPSSCYSKLYDTITLKDYSIISALHELGHAIHGNSELKACSWSIKLFRYSFPVAFDKLHWEGHQLKQ